MMNVYQSARLIGASGTLQKNKGVMFLGASGNTCDIRVAGLSMGDANSATGWTTSTIRLTMPTTNQPLIIPVMVSGVTLGTGTLYELN